MAKKSKAVQEEIPMSGLGVALVKDAKLDKLCREFIDAKDREATAKKDREEAEPRIMDRMKELGYVNYRVDDYIAKFQIGKDHIKVKKVKKLKL